MSTPERIRRVARIVAESVGDTPEVAMAQQELDAVLARFSNERCFGSSRSDEMGD